MVLPTLAHNINAPERVDSFSVALDITENLGLDRSTLLRLLAWVRIEVIVVPEPVCSVYSIMA